jgi:putative transcriptional regulator
MSSENYAERIKQLRARNGLTQQDLAESLHVSFSTVNRWENGRATPSALASAQLERIEHAKPGDTLADSIARVRTRINRHRVPHRGPVDIASALTAGVLVPGVLPGLWRGPSLQFRELVGYFSGVHVVDLPGSNHHVRIAIQDIDRERLEGAVHDAVARGLLWLTWGNASIFADEVPEGLITDEACLRAAPTPVVATDILADSLPSAWTRDTTTVLSIWIALSEEAHIPLPWAIIKNVLDAALISGLLELVEDPERWPLDAESAKNVKLRHGTNVVKSLRPAHGSMR